MCSPKYKNIYYLHCVPYITKINLLNTNYFTQTLEKQIPLILNLRCCNFCQSLDLHLVFLPLFNCLNIYANGKRQNGMDA